MNTADNSSNRIGNPTPNSHFAQRFPNTVESLETLAEAVEMFGDKMGWTNATVMQINLVLEELLVNAIDHGYPDGRDGEIAVQISCDGDTITIIISDDADPFNPFLMAAPDLSLAVANRPIGGLGIHLVRSYMDGCAYCYSQQRNQVILTKRLP
ncbi:MAG: ATP-binding protein [Methylovulum sp.]|nr:ATP-binding protein [Methylovulum sp.]